MPDSLHKTESPIYRVYRVTSNGRLTGLPTVLSALDDEEAIIAAAKLLDGAGIEVWDRARLVIALPPKKPAGKGSSS